MNKHLYVSVADHGFGHISQSSTVINQLHQLSPKIHITLQCGQPKETLKNWFKAPFDHLQYATEFGMLMNNAVDVQRDASLERYRQFHHDWDKHLHHEIIRLEQLQPDLVFSNVSYLTLAAAQHLGIDNIAMCSLNWGEILKGYAPPEDRAICQQIEAIYNSANLFIQPQPHMPMEGLNRRHSVGPLARIGQRQDNLKTRLGIGQDATLLLIGLGGIPTELPMQQWPVEKDLYFLIPDQWPLQHRNAIRYSQCQLPFIDMLASCDGLVTKPGYGSFTEASCNNIPVLYLRRQDWPEEPYLIEWLQRHNRCQELKRDEFFSGHFQQALESLNETAPLAPQPNGAQQVAEILLEHLKKQG